MAVCLSLTRQTASSTLGFLRTPSSAAALVKLSSALSTGNFCSPLEHGNSSSSQHAKLPVAAVTQWQFQVRGLSTEKEVQESLKRFKEGQFDTIADPGHLEHFTQRVHKKLDVEDEGSGSSMQGIQDYHRDSVPDPGHLEHFADRSRRWEKGQENPAKDSSYQGVQDEPGDPLMGTYALPHPIWSDEQLHSIQITHKPPEGFVDRFAFLTVKMLRSGFDLFSGFKTGKRNHQKWVKRIIFLETVAGVPGMVAAMMRHMTSLRRMQRDYGWIHTLLEEAENERMHLMTALQLTKPSLVFRTMVVASQGVFVTLFGIWYVFSPRFCHRFVGYLEEEAVKTYTKCLEDIANGPMKHWNTDPAPDVAIRYWKLPPDATMRDVILAIRADEAHHRIVNHSLASMKSDQFNPYRPGH